MYVLARGPTPFRIEDRAAVKLVLTLPRTDVLNLDITYTPTYPDELPEMDITCEEGVLTDEETERLLQGLRATGEESMGMVRWIGADTTTPSRGVADDSLTFSADVPFTLSALCASLQSECAVTATGHGLHIISIPARSYRGCTARPAEEARRGGR